LFTYACVCGHLSHFLLLANVNHDAMDMVYKYLVRFVLLIFLHIYSEVKLLDQMVILFNCLRSPKTFFHSALPSYVPAMPNTFQFFHILPNTCYFLS
jgi:hypothetical protein